MNEDRQVMNKEPKKNTIYYGDKEIDQLAEENRRLKQALRTLTQLQANLFSSWQDACQSFDI